MIVQEHVDFIYEIIDRKADTIEEKLELFMNPIWRVGNQYYCIDGETDRQFRPRPAQCMLMYWLYVLGRKRFVILKARQLGFSTLIAIIGLDHTLYNTNTTFNVCSHTEDSAKDLLREKIKFNLTKITEGMKAHALPLKNENETTLTIDDNWKIRSKVKVRSGTSNVLHISEWGSVAANFPDRSTEIRTGTLPTASSDKAIVFIESTYEGPPAGDFFDMITLSEKTTVEQSSIDSYWFMFFPWFEDARYATECQLDWIEKRTLQYFEDLVKILEKKGEPYEFSKEQMYFWQQKGYELGPKMQREMPSTKEEAMTAPVAGAFYAEALLALDRAGRITDFEWDRDKPVYAVCDVGEGDPFAVWLVQTDGRDLDLIYFYQDEKNVGHTASYFIGIFQQLGIPIARWVLPWDAQNKNSAMGWVSEFKKAGANDIVQLEKYNHSIRQQIDYMITAFPRIRMRRTATADGRVSVGAYSWLEDSPGQLKAKPEHNFASHGGSAFGYIGEAEKRGMFRLKVTKMENYYDQKPKKKEKWRLKRC